MLLKGKISKILFNNGKGYMLFSIVVKDTSSIDEDKINPQYPKNITVFGNNIMGIEEGYIIKVNGNWEHNDNGRYWPWQFKAVSFDIIEAETPETVIKFLSTLPGIGEKLANALFAEFGLNIYDVIESDAKSGNRQLTIVRGISSVKEDGIIKAYQQKQTFRSVLSAFSKYGIGETKTKNIIAKHKIVLIILGFVIGMFGVPSFAALSTFSKWVGIFAWVSKLSITLKFFAAMGV